MMRLLTYHSNDDLHVTRDLTDAEVKPYAILSHTWGRHEEEVSFQEIELPTSQQKPGYKKIEFCGKQTQQDGWQHFWVDTCCINRADFTELSEAISSMYYWYQQAQVCYVYLADVSSQQTDTRGQNWQSTFRQSRWFTRGWTLQELLAPPHVVFYSKEWERLGTKDELKELLHDITAIPISALEGHALSKFPVIERMRWTRDRQTTRKEDQAYCLLGIFGVSMSIRYGHGEGDNAFRRLQKKLDAQSHSQIDELTHKIKGWQSYAEVISKSRSAVDIVPKARVRQRFPFPRNEDIVTRKVAFSALETLLPQATQLQSAALWGLGGSGKTQIALEFSYRRHYENHWAIYWVYAGTYEQFLHGYGQIATNAGLASTLQGFELLTAVRSWLEEQSDWLMVLDNADDLTLFGLGQLMPTEDNQRNLMQYIPCGSQGNILWTTRDEQAIGHLVGMSWGIHIEDMTTDEAKELLVSISEQTETAENIVDIVGILEHLERLPLAVSQAGAFIRARGISYHGYLRRLEQEQNRWRVLSQETFMRHRPDGVPNNVMGTWQITVRHLAKAQPLAHWMLMVIVYFHNQEIPWLLIQKVGLERLQEQHLLEKNEGDVAEDIVHTALNRLVQFSLLRPRTNTHQGGNSYDIHKLVQDATRYSIRDKNWGDTTLSSTKTAAQVASQILSQAFPSGEYGTWHDCARLLPHVLKLRQWPELAKHQFEMCSLLMRASNYLHKQGRLKEAEQIKLQVLELRQKVLGNKHPDTVQSMTSLAMTYQQQGRLSEVEQIKVQILNVRQEVLGNEHAITLESMASLAITYHQQGRLSEAEQIKLEVLEVRQRMLGDNHPDTIKGMASLAATYYEQGRFKEAEEVKLQVLKLRQEVLGNEHPDTSESMANLGMTYHRQGRLSEAEQIKLEVFKARKKVLGDKHPNTIQSMASLAATYHQQGRLKEAEQIKLQVFELRQEVLGNEHPDTIDIMADLAENYHQQGRLSEAEQMYDRVLAGREKALGIEHKSTLTTVYNLGQLYQNQGKLAAAEQYLKRAAAGMQQVLGTSHPDTKKLTESLEQLTLATKQNDNLPVP